MKNNTNASPLFAFKLAQKTQEVKPATQWQARKGVATAGCTGPNERFSHSGGTDNGVMC